MADRTAAEESYPLPVRSSTLFSRALVVSVITLSVTACVRFGVPFDPFLSVTRVSLGVPTRNPLHTLATAEFDEDLLGAWAELGSKATWVFEASGARAYDLRIYEREFPARFEANLLELEGVRYLDLYALDSLELHTFYRIERIANGVRLTGLSRAWLIGEIERGQVEIEHEWAGDDLLVLTAPTPRLQEFVARRAANARAFPPTGSGATVFELRALDR